MVNNICTNNLSTYQTWHSMKDRCLNINNKRDYPKYGGRGITVCKRWMVFENFLKDMGPKPKNLSLDRKDNNGNYKLSNCKWATRVEQQNNRRNTIMYTYKNKTQSHTAWARELNIKPKTLTMRIRKGWSVTRALSTPVKKYTCNKIRI